MTVSGTIRAQQVFTKSDERAKCNIRATNHDALSMLQKLFFRHYQFRSSPQGRQVLGPIAQEVAEFLPDAVDIDENGELHVDFTSLNSLTAQGVQQLSAQMQAHQHDTHSRFASFAGLSYSRLAAWLRGWNQQLDPAVQVTHMPLTAYHCQLLLVLQAVL